MLHLSSNDLTHKNNFDLSYYNIKPSHILVKNYKTFKT